MSNVQIYAIVIHTIYLHFIKFGQQTKKCSSGIYDRCLWTYNLAAVSNSNECANYSSRYIYANNEVTNVYDKLLSKKQLFI